MSFLDRWNKRLKLAVMRWLGVQDEAKREATAQLQVFADCLATVESSSKSRLVIAADLASMLSRRLADIESKMPSIAQLQADIQVVQATRREIDALRHDMAQKPAIIKTHTASEFRKRLEGINI